MIKLYIMSRLNGPGNEPTNFAPDLEKITHPAIYDMAQEYAESGVATHVAKVLSPLPASLQQPLSYTFANHVTKERPLSILHVSEELGADREKSLGIAACTDVLWNVSIVVDDIYDKDATNARQQPSAWARFGRVAAFAASTAAVGAAVAYTARKNGLNHAYGYVPPTTKRCRLFGAVKRAFPK
jgi:geranylgeranyl pyrophosphate synthase